MLRLSRRRIKPRSRIVGVTLMAIFVIGTLFSWYQQVVEAGITPLRPLRKDFLRLPQAMIFRVASQMEQVRFIVGVTGNTDAWVLGLRRARHTLLQSI